jgi:hypothetical protein
MRLREFIKSNIGKCLDYDKAYAGQCVELFRFYGCIGSGAAAFLEYLLILPFD